MFLLPAIALPFLFFFAIRRLWRIPRGLLRGCLHVPERRKALLGSASAVAYAVLLGYTVGLAAELLRLALESHDPLSALVSATVYVLVYPLVYLAAEWIFYYGIKAAPGA
jgi:hypothetical protein